MSSSQTGRVVDDTGRSARKVARIERAQELHQLPRLRIELELGIEAVIGEAADQFQTNNVRPCTSAETGRLLSDMDRGLMTDFSDSPAGPLSLFDPGWALPGAAAGTTSAGPPFALAQQDAVEWLRTLPSASVDLIVTDPPYESLEKHRAIGTTTRLKHSKASSNDWFRIFPNSRFPELFRELFRVLAKDRHFYLFSDAETMFVARPIAEQAGFKFWKPIVWDKAKIGMGYHYRARYEFILFFEKGKRRLADLSVPDVIQEPRILNGYPTEKPVALSELLVRQSSSAGEVVIDPFLGSGSAGVAAVKLGRRFWGNDISENAVTVARPRLEAATRSR